RVGGAWGFAATRSTTREAAEEALRRALDVARAQPSAPATPLAPAEPAHGPWRSEAARDPFEVAFEDKVAALPAADDAMRGGTRVGEEAVALLSAPACPAGRETIVLDGGQLALQLHESVGHAVELDRVFGIEASYAGTSFVSVDDRDALRYGSDLMTVTADATVTGGLGSFGWD